MRQATTVFVCAVGVIVVGFGYWGVFCDVAIGCHPATVCAMPIRIDRSLDRHCDHLSVRASLDSQWIRVVGKGTFLIQLVAGVRPQSDPGNREDGVCDGASEIHGW